MNNRMKNNMNHTPRPTEYAGTRFRSKSEAVFARCLELSGYTWEYEPGEVAGHSWDFLIDRKHLCGRDQERFVFIEYKPSEPTASYIDSLTERMKHCPVESLLVYGSPWNPIGFSPYSKCYITYPIFTHDGKYGWGDFNQHGDNGEDFLFSHRHYDSLAVDKYAFDAMSYRFDLKSRANEYGVSYSMVNPHIDFDLDPVILLNFTNPAETWRHDRLKKIAAEAVKRVGLLKIHELFDHKGELTVVWRNQPLSEYTWWLNHLWSKVGEENQESVVHFDRYGDSVTK